MIKYTRSLTYDLANPVLYQMGLQAAVKWLIERFREEHQIEVELRQDQGLKSSAEDKSIILFRAIRELLTNIIKHANASKAIVSMEGNGNTIRVIFEDNGIGFDNAKIESYSIENQSMGLFNIRERIKYFGGTLDVVSDNESGTKITITVPEHTSAQ